MPSARSDRIFTTASADTAALRAQFGDIRLTPPQRLASAARHAAAIDRARTARIALLEAPAGYGKTTLLAEWAARETRPVAWASLAQRDDDPAILVELIATALCDAIPQAGSLVVQAARRGRDVLSNAAPMLASAVRAAPTPFVLFLDDVHVLRSTGSREVVDLMAAAVPPGSSIVLAARGLSAAAARLRFGAETCVLTAGDLRLTDGEALTLAAPDVAAIDTVTVRAWVDQCEGWVTGIRMFAQVAADDRAADPVPATAQLVGEYLNRELLDALDLEARELLIACAVLDSITPPLADAVHGATGSAAVLRSLVERQAFVTPSTTTAGGYRVHPLVREHLRSELATRGPAVLAGTHRRAAEWFVANGMHESAMDHWIAAGALSEAASSLAELGLPLYHAGRAATLQRWIDEIGELHIFACPPAALTAALLEMLAGDPAVAARRLRLLGTVDTDGMDASAAAHFASARALLHASHAREGVEVACDRAREGLELQGRLSPWRDVGMGVFGHLLARTGRTAEARAVCTEALDLAATFGHFETIPVSAAELALLALADDDLDAAAEHARTALRAIDDHDLSSRATSVLAQAVAALVFQRRGDRDRAARLLAAAMPRRAALTAAVPTAAALARLVLAETHCGFADFTSAEELVSEATRMLAVVPVRGDLDDRVDAVRRQIAEGKQRGHFGASAALTAAEHRVLPLLQTHLTREQIAQQLHLSRNTVGTQMSSIFRKLGAGTRTAAVQRAQELGML